MVRKIVLVFTVLVSLISLISVARAQKVGTDLASLNLCLFGDCEARGSYAADPYGWPNPATLPVGTLPYVKRGIFISGGHFFVNAGDVNADATSATVTAVYDPILLQVNYVKATGGGYVRGGPDGLRTNINMDIVRLAAAVDVGHGFSLGVIGALPVTTSEINVDFVPFNLAVARVKETRTADITVGAHWHGGHEEWFSVGAFVNGASFADEGSSLDLATFKKEPFKVTSNAWFTRLGVSLLPLYGLDELTGEIAKEHAVKSSPVFEMLSEVRLGIDWEHRNITVPDEGTRDLDIGYFGVDWRLLPDEWNILSPTLRPYGIAGVDTLGGYGIGLGIYGNPNGYLNWLAVNLAWSSRPIAKSFGDRVNVAAITASVTIPF